MKHLLIISSLFILFKFDLNSQATWIPTNGPMALSLSAFTLSSDGVWVASATSQGIFFSTDQGKTWSKRSIGLYRKDSYATSLGAGPNGIIYAIIDDEFYRMEKGIDEWEKTIYKFEDAEIYANENGTIFMHGARFDSNLYFSDDKGETFHSIQFSDFQRLDVVSLNGNGNNFFIADDKNFDTYLVKFSDDGTSVKKVRQLDAVFPKLIWHPKGKLFMLDRFNEFYRMDSTGKIEAKINSESFQQVFVKPNGDLIGLSYSADYISSDLGNHWIKKGTNLNELHLYSNFEFQDTNTYIAYSTYCRTHGNLLQCSFDAGNNWTSYDAGFKNAEYFSFVHSNGILYVLLCDNSKIHFTKDKGVTWAPLPLPNYYFETFAVSSNGYIYLAYDSNVMMSNDNGGNWKKLIVNNDTTIRIVSTDRKNALIASGDIYTYISIDGGQVWKQIVKPPIQGAFSILSFPDSTMMIIQDQFSSEHLFYISKDMGLKWDLIPFEFAYIEAYTMLRDNSIIFSGYDNSNNNFGTFLSNDKLASFSKVSTKVFNEIIEDRNENLYAFETNVQCEISKDKGKTWKNMINGLPVPSQLDFYDLTTAIEIDDDSYLYLGYSNYPVFRTSNNLTSLAGPSYYFNNLNLMSSITDQYLVFNFESSHDDPLDFSIVDQLGKIVFFEKVPHNKTENIKLDVEQLNSGLYYVKAQLKNKQSKVFKFIKT
ncbi:MAG: T9SS type A sorting domain-containing protein [Saprospiraceae bacterium]|nr:T9SS type A sorting domain-containing protein [Saprospiraceae bacterium]